ncbi:MAG: iron ABC transporter permease [Micropruina sp.]|uniref:FecCD family ABC transporter permease n=1 Tax=Micropruina sp. TaxID=2737536 RepID=UPI0039E49803
MLHPDTRRPTPLAVMVTVLTLLLIVIAVLALCSGRYLLSPVEVAQALASAVTGTPPPDPSSFNVVINLRLPRIAAAILIGAALTLAGASYQSIFRNPLAAPDLLGVTHGACVGASIAIILGLGTVWVQSLAFLAGFGALALVAWIPRLIRRSSTVTLVLAGIIVGGLMQAVIGLLKYVADPETQLADIVFWQLGSLAKVTASSVTAMAPLILVPTLVLVLLRWRLNLLTLEDAESAALGVNVRFERGVVVVCATLLTAAAVSLSGSIGWIGLVVPHAARLLAGSDNARTLPVAALLGGAFMVVIDTLARSLSPGEIPLGILTGLIGTPFFVIILARRGAEA